MRDYPPSWSIGVQRSGRSRVTLATAAALIFGLLAARVEASPSPPPSSPPVGPVATPPLDALIAEASRKFGVPASWISEVMAVESRGRADALSRKGAIGLMQVIPATYADLADRYGLGSDPWNPRDNVMAGAAYLRELYDRYGAPGFLVAYNAGPGRWEEYLSRARPLPAETVAYITRLAPTIGGAAVMMQLDGGRAPPRSAYASPLFVQLHSIAAASRAIAERARIVRLIEANATFVPQSNPLFVPSAGGRDDGVDPSASRRTDLPADSKSTVVPSEREARDPLSGTSASAKRNR
jgi:hypothetical protein